MWRQKGDASLFDAKKWQEIIIKWLWLFYEWNNNKKIIRTIFQGVSDEK